MIIENLIAFRKYMLLYYFNRHEPPVIRGQKADNILIRDMTPYNSPGVKDYKGDLMIRKTVAYYHLYLGSVELDVRQFERPTDISKELRRHIIVWCKNGLSSGVLMAEYPYLINNDGFIDYNKFKFSDPLDDMTVELLAVEPIEIIEDTGKV